MDQVLEEIKARLMDTDEEFRRLVEEHADLDRQIQELEAKHPQTFDDEIEEHRLKKLKLAAKDRMTEILHQHQAQHA